MDINLTTPSLANVLGAGSTNNDTDITSNDGKAVLHATSSGAGVSFNNGGVGEYANVQMDAVSVSIEHNALINITAPQVTVDGAQTVTGQEDAQSFKITGTSGNGKELFRHQSVDATSTGQHTALFAGSDGELYQKNDGNAVTKIATAVDLSSYETSLHASSTYQPILTSANFGTFVNGLSAKATPIDADLLSVADTADSNKEKKTTFLQAWTNYFKGKADAVYTTTSAVATQITTALSGYLTSATAASTYEPIITKGTAFNKNFGTSSGDILLQTGTTASKMLITDSNNKVTSSSFSSGDIVLNNDNRLGEWLQLGATTYNPADSTTYYIGLFPSLAPGTSTAGREFTFISTGTITRMILTYENSATGTSESVSLYLRNNTTATDYLIGTFTMDAGANATGSFIFSPSITISNTTDKYSIKIVTPAWVTNPTTVYTSVRLLNKF